MRKRVEEEKEKMEEKQGMDRKGKAGHVTLSHFSMSSSSLIVSADFRVLIPSFSFNKSSICMRPLYSSTKLFSCRALRFSDASDRHICRNRPIMFLISRYVPYFSTMSWSRLYRLVVVVRTATTGTRTNACTATDSSDSASVMKKRRAMIDGRNLALVQVRVMTQRCSDASTSHCSLSSLSQ